MFSQLYGTFCQPWYFLLTYSIPYFSAYKPSSAISLIESIKIFLKAGAAFKGILIDSMRLIGGKIRYVPRNSFLVGPFSLKEKSPTITVGSLFQLTISLWMVHFSYNSYNFLQFLLRLRSIFTSSKKLNGAKGYSRRVFSAETFFRKKNSPKGPTFNFLIFSDRMDVEKSHMVPLSVFSALWDFPIFFIKGSPIHQYFDILKSFWYFWALDMAPTWAVPGLLCLWLSVCCTHSHEHSIYSRWVGS